MSIGGAQEPDVPHRPYFGFSGPSPARFNTSLWGKTKSGAAQGKKVTNFLQGFPCAPDCPWLVLVIKINPIAIVNREEILKHSTTIHCSSNIPLLYTIYTMYIRPATFYPRSFLFRILRSGLSPPTYSGSSSSNLLIVFSESFSLNCQLRDNKPVNRSSKKPIQSIEDSNFTL